MGTLVAFSWGYSGWGNHTRELAEMVDAVEAARGFDPPLFVDVRLRRQVRAIGFRDRAFEKVVGADRYVWMPGLGNRAIGDGSGVVQLDEPAAIEDLLARVLDGGERRRVIFFCSCQSPHARASCHRGLVVDALIEAAARRATKLRVQEWPGGVPVVANVTVSDAILKQLQGSGELTRIPLPVGVSLAAAGALPCCSVLRFRNGATRVFAPSGPATMTARGWTLPIGPVLPALQDDLFTACEEERQELCLDAFGAPDDTVPWLQREL